MTLRHLLSWKPLFYEALLPALRRLGPARGDAVLGAIGRLTALGWPPRRRALEMSLRQARSALGADWEVREARDVLAGHILRFLARDYPLHGLGDEALASRFDVHGFEHLRDALAGGRGVVLLGSHLGGHLSALHWLYRRGVPLRVLVQRPQHISATLRARFDSDEPPHPQTGLFLRRALPPGAAVERVLRARAALRDGMAVYLAGDVPWSGPNARPGELLGHRRAFQSIWADLATLARAPVVPMFCTHRPRGRFALTFDPPWSLAPGGEGAAVARYLDRLEAEVRAHPADAVAYLTWPCYGPPSPAPRAESGPSSQRGIGPGSVGPARPGAARAARSSTISRPSS
ncbi:MAG TPA: lysophospholipid acyltransferase family protein [Isosphaeraceae bacterium]|nr:lysophospholipid acyltransferase family protein [Isosphaeraceae bacterium]